MRWLLRKCGVILYCARKSGAVAIGTTVSRQRSAIGQRHFRTSLFRRSTGFAFANALPDDVDVKHIRTKARMSQAEFARAFCINPRTLQEWEQGQRKPDATTRAYLAVIAKNREAVLDALAS